MKSFLKVFFLTNTYIKGGMNCIHAPDNAKVIEVASTTLGAKRFFERDHHAGNVVPIPDGTKNTISKPAAHSVSTVMAF